MGQAALLERALAATPEEPGQKRLCQDCHDRPVAYRGIGICRRCYLRRARQSIPTYEGLCKWAAGCPKEGRGRSGYCRPHYQQSWHRQNMWRTVFARQLGTDLSVDDIQRGLEEVAGSTPLGSQALVVMRVLVGQVAVGHITLAKNPWHGQRS